MGGAHAKFAPSKSPVWGNCTGAMALLEAANLPDEPASEHAASGTLTHMIAEDILDDGILGDDYMVGKKVTVEGFTFTVDEERIERAMVYIRAVLARGGVQFYEVKMSGLPWYGTGDTVVARVEEHALEAHDLKDGNGKITAQDNEQLICYLLLAWEDLGWLDDFQIFRGFIHQPKINWTDQAEYTREQMLEWKERLLTKYRRGADLIGETPNKIKTALNAGPWCEKGWCRMRGNCPARTQHVVDQFPDLTVRPHALTDFELADIMSREHEINAFFNDLRGEALGRAKAGATLPGWKLAQGRQGPRKWVDETSAGDYLYELLLADAYERSLISPTTAEKKLKKLKKLDEWTALQSNISRSEGQLTLIPEADSRAPATLDAPEFGIVDTASDLIG